MGLFADLVANMSGRKRLLPRDAALVPKHIEKVIERLEADGDLEAADTIHSLVWQAEKYSNRCEMPTLLALISLRLTVRKPWRKCCKES
ncbi:hypothetical protein ACKF11_13370 [Methylobacillus sp. Pita2]|uniref:hypothetical protein n=1 Tax=Methylobacillus sp. Pita2 TaxID=3383245 RepID=UPI0038B6B1CF